MNKSRVFRLFGAALFVPALGLFSGDGFGQSYPEKPIRWIIVTGAGGGVDVLSRTIAPKLSENLGQPLVIDNRPGAGTVIAMDLTAKARPDGYTMVTASQSFTINASFYKKLPYDTENDFAAVTVLTISGHVLVLHPSVPSKSLPELIALAKSRPGQINYGSPGIGTSLHLIGELLNIMAGVNMVHVAYKGGPPLVTGLLSGEVQFAGLPMLTVHPLIEASKLKALAMTGAKRSTVMPELPTISEAGIPGFDVSPWYGVLVPAKTPKPIITRLHTEIVKALRMPEIQKAIARGDEEIVANTPEEFAAILKKETAKWAKVVKDANIKIE